MTPPLHPPRPRSEAELLLSVQLEQAGIPFRREFRFAEIMDPPRKWRADFAIGHGMYDLLIEVEGGAYVQGRHTRGPAFEADCEKYAAAAILGYRVIRATPRQVEDGRCLSWIKQALGIEQGGTEHERVA